METEVAKVAVGQIEQFRQVFREEHRAIRDTLLDLIQALEARNLSRAGFLLQETARLTGPHFRYEEEAMYPALVRFLGSEYVEKLLGDHDRAIGAAKRLVSLLNQDALKDSDVDEAIRLVRGLLPHVSDCEGLSIMVERLADDRVQSILDAREHSREANLDLLTWAASIRPRPSLDPTAPRGAVSG